MRPVTFFRQTKLRIPPHLPNGKIIFCPQNKEKISLYKMNYNLNSHKLLEKI